LLYYESGESIDRVCGKLLLRNSALIDELGSRMSGTTDAVSIRDRIRIWPPIGEKELLVLLHLLKAKRPGIAGMTELRRATGLSKAGFQRTLFQLMRRGYIQHAAGKFTLESDVGGVFTVTPKGLVYAMAQHDGLWSVFDAVALLFKADCPPVLAKWRELSAASSRSARLLLAEATRFGYEDWGSLDEHFIQELVKSLAISETDKRRLLEVVFRDGQAREHFLAVFAELERRQIITGTETSKIQQLLKRLESDAPPA
jgi:DNA-binding MarR family transcriptional regulator